MSPAALDNAVYELIAREFGVANAMRFIARHNQPDGINYTQDRENWLPQDPNAIDRLLGESNPKFERLVAESRKKGQGGCRQAGAYSPKSGGRRKK